MAVVNLCPECRYGKHAACNGEALDHGVDAITECDCFLRDHRACQTCRDLLAEGGDGCQYGQDHCEDYGCVVDCGACGPEARADARGDGAADFGREE